MDTLFKLEEGETSKKQCRECKHAQRWQCNSKVFHYCGARKSNRTNNGLLKIKLKNTACIKFEADKQ